MASEQKATSQTNLHTTCPADNPFTPDTIEQLRAKHAMSQSEDIAKMIIVAQEALMLDDKCLIITGYPFGALINGQLTTPFIARYIGKLLSDAGHSGYTVNLDEVTTTVYTYQKK